MDLRRRNVLQALAFLGFIPAIGSPTATLAGMPELEGDEPFSPDTVRTLAQALSKESFTPSSPLPKAWRALSYHQHHEIQPRAEKAVWAGREDVKARGHLLAPGSVYRTPVNVFLVEDNRQRRLVFDADAFHFGPDVPNLPINEQVNYSGVELLTPDGGDQQLHPFLTFQGASYFRAIAQGQHYGLSARGLALRTATHHGEEFPAFRTFWLETPDDGDQKLVVHALLESPSVSGAYTFHIWHGNPTRMDVSASLFPRVDLDHVGIAPLTSMFLYDEKNRIKFDDVRPAIHDSDGLLVHNGNGEWLWRPLNNPASLQVSQFLDTNPQGFGLAQRSREFSDFADPAARYEIRPTLWVEPHDPWGKGAVSLVEIPSDKETNDNIVAFWRPDTPLEAEREHRFGYTLQWCWEPPVDCPLSKVQTTREGKSRTHARVMAIDFHKSDLLPDDAGAVRPFVSGYPGAISNVSVTKNPETGGMQLLFDFDPGEETAMELRAQLRTPDGKNPLTEVWLYRWTS
ncbi:glucan biosynthesis protein [Coralliovum pocilloporae]|uniref:glucan biosynthesis protein n=1 Tax=Coralliovum pocilloporae TaxID=3066369 RepID=UPI0033070BC9